MAALPLTDMISQGSSKRRAYRVLTAEYGDGYSQDVADGINNVRDEWSLAFEAMTLSERDTLVTFLDAHGSAATWTWQAFGDATTKMWKTSKDGWNESFPAGHLYTITFLARQVY